VEKSGSAGVGKRCPMYRAGELHNLRTRRASSTVTCRAASGRTRWPATRVEIVKTELRGRPRTGRLGGQSHIELESGFWDWRYTVHKKVTSTARLSRTERSNLPPKGRTRGGTAEASQKFKETHRLQRPVGLHVKKARRRI